jgi:Uma2 family endonuclease
LREIMPARADLRYTFEDYLEMPEDHARRYEIIDGKLFISPTPLLRHQEVVGNVIRILHGLARERDLGKVVLGPITVRLADDTVMSPDVHFIRADRLGIVDEERGVLGAPDLVIEVLSPYDREFDRTLKRTNYLARGVPELWILDADEDWIEVWRPGVSEPEMPEDIVSWRVGEKTFEIPLAEVFRR